MEKSELNHLIETTISNTKRNLSAISVIQENLNGNLPAIIEASMSDISMRVVLSTLDKLQTILNEDTEK